MRLLIDLSITIALVATVVFAQAPAPDPGLKKAVEAREAALAAGDAETWGRFTTDDFPRIEADGVVKTVDGKTAWAFIHGNSGLDNGAGAEFCGVSTELRLVRELGCFADFTFPSLYSNAQPRVVNRIYMAHDDQAPKSYWRPLPLDGP